MPFDYMNPMKPDWKSLLAAIGGNLVTPKGYGTNFLTSLAQALGAGNEAMMAQGATYQKQMQDAAKLKMDQDANAAYIKHLQDQADYWGETSKSLADERASHAEERKAKIAEKEAAAKRAQEDEAWLNEPGIPPDKMQALLEGTAGDYGTKVAPPIASMGEGISPGYPQKYNQGLASLLQKTMAGVPSRMEKIAGGDRSLLNQLILRQSLGSKNPALLDKLIQSSESPMIDVENYGKMPANVAYHYIKKPGKQIERTVDLGDKQRIYYTSGEEEDIPKGMTPGQQARINISVGKGGKDGALTKEDARAEGVKYLLTGKLPFTGMSGVGRKEMLHEGNQYAREQGWTPRMVLRMQADYKAMDKSVANQRKNYDMMNGFVMNMDKQMQRLEDVYKTLPRAGMRLLNIPIVKLRQYAMGSGEEASAAAILIELGNESGKLSTNSAASIRELSESAQKQWADIHDNKLSFNDLKKVLTTTRQIGHDRLNSTKSAMDFTLEGIENLGGGDHPATPQSGATPKGGTAKKVGRFTVEVE